MRFLFVGSKQEAWLDHVNPGEEEAGGGRGKLKPICLNPNSKLIIFIGRSKPRKLYSGLCSFFVKIFKDTAHGLTE